MSEDLSPSTLDQINGVFRDVFADDELVVTRETTAADVDGWDSLMHVNLVIAAEKHFGVRAPSSKVASLQNVGELVDLIENLQRR